MKFIKDVGSCFAANSIWLQALQVWPETWLELAISSKYFSYSFYPFSSSFLLILLLHFVFSVFSINLCCHIQETYLHCFSHFHLHTRTHTNQPASPLSIPLFILLISNHNHHYLPSYHIPISHIQNPDFSLNQLFWTRTLLPEISAT